MKKSKIVVCTILLSTVMVGNVFASSFTTAGVLSLFDGIINALVSAAREPETCPLRFCTNCKPGTNDDGNGNCRPPQN